MIPSDSRRQLCLGMLPQVCSPLPSFQASGYISLWVYLPWVHTIFRKSKQIQQIVYYQMSAWLDPQERGVVVGWSQERMIDS